MSLCVFLRGRPRGLDPGRLPQKLDVEGFLRGRGFGGRPRRLGAMLSAMDATPSL
jgi:hypothetical protein